MGVSNSLKDSFREIGWYLERSLVDGAEISLTKVFDDNNRPNRLTGYVGNDDISKEVINKISRKLPVKYREDEFIVEAMKAFLRNNKSSTVIVHSSKTTNSPKGAKIPRAGNLEVENLDNTLTLKAINLNF